VSLATAVKDTGCPKASKFILEYNIFNQCVPVDGKKQRQVREEKPRGNKHEKNKHNGFQLRPVGIFDQMIDNEKSGYEKKKNDDGIEGEDDEGNHRVGCLILA
jgi:hypothetical protein